MHVTGARENNLRGLDVRIPLGVQVGVCGVSGSGKSSLVVDTIALALARPKTNIPAPGVIRVEPGAHDDISGAPDRTVVADQSRAEITSPGMFLGLIDAVRKAFAASEVAARAGHHDQGPRATAATPATARARGRSACGSCRR